MKTNATVPPVVEDKRKTKLAESDTPAIVAPKPTRGRKKKASTEQA